MLFLFNIKLKDRNSYEQTKCLAKLGAFYFIQERNEHFFIVPWLYKESRPNDQDEWDR